MTIAVDLGRKATKPTNQHMGVMYNFNNSSAAVSHRLLKFVLNKSLDKSLLFHCQKCKLSYLHNLRFHEY